MLIKALCDYAIKNPSTIPKGFEEKQINYRIILSTDGDIVDIVPFTRTIHTKNKTETEPQIALLPKRSQKSGRSYDSNYIEHRPLYIFGLNYDAENNTFTPDDKTNKAKNSHKAFVEHELEFFKDLDSVACTAYKRFIEKWNPENEIDNPFLLQLGKNYAESYYGFSVDCESNYLETDEQFIQKYTKLIQDTEQKLATDTENTAICGILGIKDRIAETHDKVTIPGGPSRLVSMKLNAFESYGVKKSYNSNISNTAMKMYTDALNRLFKDKNHYCHINDMVLLWFAIKSNDSAECNLFSKFLNAFQNDETDNELASIMNCIKHGYINDLQEINKLVEDTSVDFYIVGFTSNMGRICVKFIYRNTFDNILKNLMQHQIDMMIRKDVDRVITFNNIANELVSPKTTNPIVPPPLLSSIMYAVFNNTKYPDALYTTILRRLRTDINCINMTENKYKFETRIGIIKAYLNRKHSKEEITMAWDEKSKNIAYLCGGLFAIYEKIQRDSYEGKLNRTIKNSYFTSACTCPSATFPRLAKLANYHMSKLSYGSQVYYNRDYLTPIFNIIGDKFPTTFSLDEQGSFVIGYYHMNQKLYTSTKDVDNTKAVNEDEMNRKDV